MQAYYRLMRTFGWTLEYVKKLDLLQIRLLIELIDKEEQAKARAARRAMRRR